MREEMPTINACLLIPINYYTSFLIMLCLEALVVEPGSYYTSCSTKRIRWSLWVKGAYMSLYEDMSQQMDTDS